MSQQNQTINRRCFHGVVTMGELNRCKDCQIEKLESDNAQLLKQLNGERRDNDVLIMRNIGLAQSLRETLDFIEKPMYELVLTRLKRHYYATLYKIFACYYRKKHDIMKLWASLKQELSKL